MTDMASMFYKCSTLTSLDVCHFNTALVKYMKYMFYFYSQIDSLDLTSFNTQQCNSFGSIFYGCDGLIVYIKSNNECENLIRKIPENVFIDWV